jgi:UDP-glucose 4-epimerase
MLESAGWTVQPFDLSCGQDLLEAESVLNEAEGCEAIVHAGAIAHDLSGTPAQIMATNVLGTWHVLLAAEARQMARVVTFSSAHVFGFADGEGVPDYLPVDDNHPLRAARPYGLSKRLAEEMCAAWTARTGISTIVLRPVIIVNDDSLASLTDLELNAFVHVDDVAEATVGALTASIDGHHRLTLCGPGDFDTSAAFETIGWQARRGRPS